MKLRSSVGSDVEHRTRRTNQLNQKAYFRDAVTDRDVLKNCSLAVNRYLFYFNFFNFNFFKFQSLSTVTQTKKNYSTLQ